MSDTKSNQRKKSIGLVVIAACATALTALALRFDVAHEMESRTWDWRLEGLARRSPPDPAIKLIVIDQASLDFYAREESIFWQWPREMYEPIVKFLTHARARGVAFDVLYTEPSPYGVKDDASFAAALQSGLPTVMAVAGRRDVAAESAADTELFRRRARERRVASRQVQRRQLPLDVLDGARRRDAARAEVERVDRDLHFFGVVGVSDSAVALPDEHGWRPVDFEATNDVERVSP